MRVQDVRNIHAIENAEAAVQGRTRTAKMIQKSVLVIPDTMGTL